MRRPTPPPGSTPGSPRRSRWPGIAGSSRWSRRHPGSGPASNRRPSWCAPSWTRHWTPSGWGTGARCPTGCWRAAAPGYLSAYGRNNGPEDWFGAAMAYATSQEAGRVGLFRADRRTASGAAADGFSYTMHPLVEGWQHRRRPPGLIPPETLWQALLEHADRGDLLRLAQGARGLGADDRAEAIEAAADAYLTRRLPRLPAVGARTRRTWSGRTSTSAMPTHRPPRAGWTRASGCADSARTSATRSCSSPTCPTECRSG